MYELFNSKWQILENMVKRRKSRKGKDSPAEKRMKEKDGKF